MNLVKRSLYLCIGILLGLIGVQGVQSMWQSSRLANAAEQIATSSTMKDRAQKLWSTFLEAETAYHQVTQFSSIEDTEAQGKLFEQRAASLRKAVEDLKSVAGADQGGISAKVEAWLTMAERHAGTASTTALPSYHLLDRAHAELLAQLGDMRSNGDQQAVAAIASSRALAHQVYWWTGAEMLVAVGLGSVLGWLALVNLHRTLGADASEVARVANAVAAGDLTIDIRTEGLPEGSVMAATARMQKSLIKTVQNVRTISGGLAHGVNEIAMGNGNLSARTEQQAAALERTASTMDQLGSTVRHNADNAGQASKLVDTASQVATQGGTVVNEAVLTMRGINESSQKISEIIGVIDGIAFQTNILALNAAVEAARAGDQGRGFAVVASEVRSLAQRSAGAAKEIKTLISDSVARVDRGSALVERAGSTMEEVVASIRRVTAVMGEISHASAEQSTGVAQVGQAITELDQATQQNAALAEQSAAAAATLKDRGRELVDAVSFFKTPA
jgi:methyl-accepting chemotaxis protein